MRNGRAPSGLVLVGSILVLLALAVVVIPAVSAGPSSVAPAEGSEAVEPGESAVANSLEQEPIDDPAPEAGAQAQEGQIEGVVSLPEGIVWETNNVDPPIGSPEAIRGGTLNVAMSTYPLTFRLMGPNANLGSFVGWNRAFTFNFTLVARHPVTDNYIPLLATHWSVQDDQRTLYFRLDPDAHWSDGVPITADDYVFTWRMIQSEHIVDPFYNIYAEEYYESVDKIDDYTLRIVGTRESWRPLSDFGEMWPTPSHSVVLEEDWVDRTNNQYQIAAGPYVVAEVSRGESVTLERPEEWWGDDKRYLSGRFNFDRIHLRVIPRERELDYLRRGELDFITESSSRRWNEEYSFDAVRNGWIRRVRAFIDTPSGLYGLFLNLEAPIFQNKDFRKAMQHLFNFDRLNQNLLYGEAFRQVSFFEGSEYANPALEPYPFDPVKAREHLERAGYRRASERAGTSLLGKISNVARGLLFTRSDVDDILVNSAGQRAEFTVLYASPTLTPHLTVVQQEVRRAGVNMKLQTLEGGTMLERLRERKYEMVSAAGGAGFYPAPRQYLHSEYQEVAGNNNLWGFGMAEVDSLLEVYETDLEFQNRLAAMHRIDEIVQDEAFYLPFWTAPFVRLVHWDYLQFPESYLPPRTYDLEEYLLFWIDPQRRARLDDAMAQGEALPLDEDIDKDYYGIRERLER